MANIVGRLCSIFATPQGALDLVARKPEVVDIFKSSAMQLMEVI